MAGMILVSFLWATNLVMVPYTLKVMVNRVATHVPGTPIWPLLLTPTLSFLGLSLGLGLTFRFNDFLLMRFIPNFKRDIQHAMFTYLEGHSYVYFQNNFAGALSNKVMDLVRGMPEILQLFMDTFVAAVVGIVAVSITLANVNPLFSLIFGSWAILFLVMAGLFARKCQPYAAAYSEARSTVSGKLVDSVSNMINVRLFARHSFENHYLRRFTDDVVKKDRAIQWFLILVRSVLMTSVTAMMGFMLWALITAKSHGTVSAGDFVLIMTAMGRIVDMLWNVTNQFVRFFMEVGTCNQALTIVVQPHQITDTIAAPQLTPTTGTITFESVTFRYTDSPLFNQLSLRISGGNKVGLVGFSGSGKSSFVNLILRFFDINSGRILIDDQDISLVSQASLHESISMIPQDTALFHRSLMDNIRYGRLDASDSDVLEASQKSYCHDFIERIPEGYQALVGERGIKLSGGQRQRIAIARAMLKNAPILILDEATSALDSVTEAQIQESLIQLMKGRTTIVIAHRLSTLSQMDRLLVFDQGKIVQDGSHSELISQAGHYQTLWQLQSNGFLPG